MPERRFLRPLLLVLVLGLFLVGGTSFVLHGLDTWHWSPPLVTMISLTVGNVGLAMCCVAHLREGEKEEGTCLTARSAS